MKITKEIRSLPAGVPSLKELKGTDFLIVARVDKGCATTEYTLEFRANYAANAMYAAIAVVSAEQQVNPAEVIVSHVAMRHATTGEMVKVL